MKIKLTNEQAVKLWSLINSSQNYWIERHKREISNKLYECEPPFWKAENMDEMELFQDIKEDIISKL